ncbi:outer membrane beta-barrel protein [uncultured Croceitalea sp.]|uniref:outer membrane beta-barrel protein n=1 Tax=uncultured Croceitalea sp. TaxID=1798908 RepID=UPI003305F128
MEKRNLDKLFQEKFSDFSEVPDQKVWAAIEASLEKKQKKRIIPIWWQLGGVAALLAILLYVANPFEKENLPNTNTVTDRNTEQVDKETHTNDSINKEPQLLEQTQPNTETELTSHDTEKTSASERNEKQSHEALVKSEKTNNVLIEKGALQEKARETKLAKNDNSIQKDGNRTVLPTVYKKGTQAIAETNVKKDDEIQNDSFDKTKPENAVADNTQQAADTILKPNRAIFDENVKKQKVAQQEQDDKKSIYDAIEEQLKNEEEQIAQADLMDNRWAMGPSVAPVYFDAIGQGSPIHSDFSPNSKSGNVNLSYGVVVSYEVTKKLSIRSGLHKVDFGYDTNDVLFSSSLDGSTSALIDNINYTASSRNLVVESKSNAPNASADNPEFLTSSTGRLEGRMIQQLGYLEVPLELNYALIDKKFGVNVIGGISSLFLVDSNVSLESADESLITTMGEANNANSINFSTNIGLGFNYKFSPKVQLNLEPIFKYQLNTFSETAGQFRPYALGVYSGVSFKF